MDRLITQQTVIAETQMSLRKAVNNICESYDYQIERQIQTAYLKLCKAKTKAAKTRAWDEMLNLKAQHTWQWIAKKEQQRISRINNGG